MGINILGIKVIIAPEGMSDDLVDCKVAFTLGAILRLDVAARWMLKIGYKKICRVVYTKRDMARCHGAS